jgi:hypothetical protein
MEWTPEAVKAEMAYRTVDPVTLSHLREARKSAPPRWWQRLRTHRSGHDVDDGNGERRAA